MTAYLIQAPQSKRWHIGVFVRSASSAETGSWQPLCGPAGGSTPPPSFYRLKDSAYIPTRLRGVKWRKPRPVICGDCIKVRKQQDAAIAELEAEQ